MARALICLLLAVPRRSAVSSIEVANQLDCRIADRHELLKQIFHGATGEFSVRDIVVLLVAFNRRLVATRDAQHPIAHDAFGIAEVAEHFFHAPLAGSIAKFGLLGELTLLRRSRVSCACCWSVATISSVFYQRNIPLIVRIVFGRLRTVNAGRREWSWIPPGVCFRTLREGRAYPSSHDIVSRVCIARSRSCCVARTLMSA